MKILALSITRLFLLSTVSLWLSGCGVNRFSASTKAYYKTPDGMVVEYESNKENEGVVVEIRTIEDKTKSITIKVEKSGTSEQAISAALASTLELTRMLKDALASALKAGAMAGS